MKVSTERSFFVRSVAIGLLSTVLILAPGLSNHGFVAYLAKGRAFAQTVTTYTYDNNGNMLSRTTGNNTDAFTYDTENRLISANIQTGGTPGILAYTYDDNGLRTSATTAGVTTSFLLDKNRDYAQVVLERTSSGLVDYTYGHRLISQNRIGVGSRFYLPDGQLSIRQLVSQTGLLTDTYTYDAFGELLASTGTTLNSYRYSGEQFDPNSRFYYLRARYYDQATGRFTATDPLDGRETFPLSLHRYLYADVDPVNKIDPSGELAIFAAIPILLFIIGVISFGIGVSGVSKSFAKKQIEGRTNRFLYKSCGTTQLGFGVIGGSGSAVIAEQPAATLKDPDPQGRKYSLSFRGFQAGGEYSKEFEQAAVPFSTYQNQNRTLDAFIGEGLLLNIGEAKLGLGGTLLTSLALPDKSVVPQVFNISFAPKRRLGLSLGSAATVHFVGLDQFPAYFTQNGLACTSPPKPE